MGLTPSKYHAGEHVEDNALLSEESVCPVCLYSGRRKPMLLLQKSPDVHLLSCDACGGYSASRLPTEETLRLYYSRYYQHSENAVTFGEPIVFARHVLRYVGKFLKKDCVSILDFGGGGGGLSNSIAVLLRENGVSDVSIDLVDYNSDRGRDELPHVKVSRHQTMSEVKGTSFDLVLASAVVEHIPLPRQVLIDLLCAIRPGGVFYARTPSVAHIIRILQFCGLQLDFTFPGHIHDLGQEFWEGIPDTLRREVGKLVVVSSRPSIVETCFRHDAVRTVAAYLLKAPWYVLGRRYKLVGGWEVVFHRPVDAVRS